MNQYRAVIDRYYLDTAAINRRIDTVGNKVMVIGSSAEAATIYVEAKGSNLQGTGSLPLQNRDWLATPIGFEQLSLTWAAQPGAWVDVLVMIIDPAPTAFEYVRQQRGTIDSIANTVNVNQIPGSVFNPKILAILNASYTEIPANASRKEILLMNTNGSNSITLAASASPGANDVFSLLAGTSISLPTTAAIWAKTASGGNFNIIYIEV